MKKILLFVTGIIFVSLFASVSFAANTVTESPKVKIVIDGNINKFSNNPISYNGRTMLPFREISSRLGVENDNDHIIWNGRERSVTLKKDGVNVTLRIGSKKAIVNSEEQTLDAEPIIYKNTTYIPARFVSQALGKKVVWDKGSSSVLIRDGKGYDEVKGIIEKSNAATNNASKMKCTYTADVKMSAAGESTSMKMSGNMEMDVKNLIMHMTTSIDGLLGETNKTEQYYANNKSYVKDPISGKWMYTEVDIEQVKKQMSQQTAIELSEKMFAGLTVDNSSKSDEIILKGNIYMDSLMDQLGDTLKGTGTGVEFNSVYMEMSLDKTTYVPKAVKMQMSMAISVTVGGKTEKVNTDMTMDMKYTDFNGDYEVKIPDEVLKNAEKLGTIGQ